jgi:hypothetical protein
MNKFKPGDKVIRKFGDYANCKEGDVYIISKISNDIVYLLNDNNQYDIYYFDLVKPIKKIYELW